MKKVFALTAAIMLLCTVGGSAFAGWTVVNLHPAGASNSYAYGVSGGEQAGYATFGYYVSHAGLWSGTAESWVDLNPAGASNSCSYGVTGGQQVGYAEFANYKHAGLWSGTAGSWVDLHPAGASNSCAYGVSGGEQVGYAQFVNYDHAGLWSGTAGSWVDLNPAGASNSHAYGVSGDQQVGDIQDGWGDYHASLWSGTAASWVDLNPIEWYRGRSQAYGVSGGQQVGYAHLGHYYSQAVLWSGTAASRVNLNPAGAEYLSVAYGVSGGRQVGYACVGGGGSIAHAGLWSGTAESWVDLHALLPTGVYRESYARSIDVSAGDIWVAGYAYNPSTGHNEAMLWHGTAPTVTSITPNSGLNIGSVSITDLAGTGFMTGASVKLTKSGETDIAATGVTVVSESKITCTFDLTASGQWDVVVTNLDALSGTLANGFAVIAGSIGDAKSLPTGAPVYIQDAVVTAPSLEAGSVFVESSDRSGGIKLVTNQALSPGDRVKFTGHIDRVDGEYRIDDVVFDEPASPGAVLDPILMTTLAVGSDRTETLNYEAMNTTGLLVTLVGKITGVITAQNVVYVDDGGSYEDGYGPVRGLRCHVPSGVSTTWKNKYYAITGISRVQKVTLAIWGEVNGDWYAPGTVVYVPYIDALSAVLLHPK